jgi:microcompartment protein CcmL/EutN
MKVPGPAVALFELESIARGMLVADALLKRAAVHICRAEAVTPGKYLVLFSGPVAEVQESLHAGVEAAGSLLLDQLFLAYASPKLVWALEGKLEPASGSIAIVETHTVAAALQSADRALKRADVCMNQLHLAKGIGGKGFYVLAGALDAVEAAVEAAVESIGTSLLVGSEIIQRPHSELQGPVL